MKKSLVALAAMLAVGGAYAQSSVTMGGIFKAGIATTKYANGASANGTGQSVGDGSSRLLIGFNEDLGGGLRATGQVDIRMRIDDNGGAGAAPTSAVASQLATGNTWLGLAGGFGSFRLGKLDTHYCYGADQHGSRATALSASSCAILGFVGSGAATAAIANASRSTNIIRYDLPAMSGFTGGLAYSTAFQSTEGLLGADKGNAVSANFQYAGGPIVAGVSYWNAKNETKTLIQKGGTAAVRFIFGPFSAGVTYDKSHSGTLGAEAVRDAVSVPLTFTMGPGTLLATFTKASDLKRVNKVADSGASLISVGYDYSLSKRTSIGVSFARLSNDRNAAYSLYTQGALVGHASGTNNGTALPNQDQQQLYFGIRNAF
jgi:predicted porin